MVWTSGISSKSSLVDASSGCRWASMRPGITVLPLRSNFSVEPSASFIISSFEPTAMNLLPLTAMA